MDLYTNIIHSKATSPDAIRGHMNALRQAKDSIRPDLDDMMPNCIVLNDSPASLTSTCPEVTDIMEGIVGEDANGVKNAFVLAFYLLRTGGKYSNLCPALSIKIRKYGQQMLNVLEAGDTDNFMLTLDRLYRYYKIWETKDIVEVMEKQVKMVMDGLRGYLYMIETKQTESETAQNMTNKILFHYRNMVRHNVYFGMEGLLINYHLTGKNRELVNTLWKDINDSWEENFIRTSLVVVTMLDINFTLLNNQKRINRTVDLEQSEIIQNYIDKKVDNSWLSKTVGKFEKVVSDNELAVTHNEELKAILNPLVYRYFACYEAALPLLDAVLYNSAPITF